MNVLDIPEVARLNERLLRVQQRVDETPAPEPAFLGLSHRKMRRTAARIRAGKYKVPAGDVPPEQIAEALERTIRWEETMKWARAEYADIEAKYAEIEGAAAARAMDHAVKFFHAGKEVVKKQGDSDLAKAIEEMKRAWRRSFPRVRTKRGRRKLRHPERSAGPGD